MKHVTELVKVRLIGLDSNAFNLMGAFKRAARRQGTPKEEIDAVIKDCMSSDYTHLLCTLMDDTVDPDAEAEEEERRRNHVPSREELKEKHDVLLTALVGTHVRVIGEDDSWDTEEGTLVHQDNGNWSDSFYYIKEVNDGSFYLNTVERIEGNVITVKK